MLSKVLFSGSFIFLPSFVDLMGSHFVSILDDKTVLVLAVNA